MQDTVWMLFNAKTGFWYSPPGKSASEAWENAIQWERHQFPEHTLIYARKSLQSMGLKAKRVTLTVAK